MPTLSDKIKAAEEALVGLKDELVQATKDLEAAPEEDALLTVVDELTVKVEKSEATLASLQRAEKALAARAKPADGGEGAPAAGDGAPAFIKAGNRGEPKNPGDVIFKHAAAQFIGFVEKKPIAQVMEERYGNLNYVKATFNAIHKTHVDPAMTTTSGWAAELVQSDTRGFIDSLKEVSVAAALAARATSLDFGGYQSVKIPRRNPLGAAGAGVTEPAWVAEGRPIPLTQFSFGSTELFRYKLAAISTFTEELAQRSTPAIEGILRDALREAYAQVLDHALLSNAQAVTGVRPSGLLYDDLAGAAVTDLGATAGGGEDAVRGDIMKLVSAMTGAKLGARPVLLLNNLDVLGASMMVSLMSERVFADSLSSGNLEGIPVISSGNVPQHQAFLVDAAYLATAFDAPLFDVSNTATVVENSADTTAPTMVAVTASGAAGAAAGQVAPTEGVMVNTPTQTAAAGSIARSLWQTWSVGESTLPLAA